MTPPSLPTEITKHTGAAFLSERPFQGMNFETYVLHAERGIFILKVARTPRLAAELAAEQRILRQLGPLEAVTWGGPEVPRPIAFVHHQGTGLSLLSMVPGNNVVELLPSLDRAGRERLIAAAAHTLRQIHGWQPALPRPTEWATRALERTRRRVQGGAVDRPIRHFGQFRGTDPGELLATLEQRLPIGRDELVFCHGDYCLPNILAVDGRISGVVDWSRGRYADRRYDLAIAMWSVGYNVKDPALVDLFVAEYGYQESKEELWPFQALYALS